MAEREHTYYASPDPQLASPVKEFFPHPRLGKTRISFPSLLHYSIPVEPTDLVQTLQRDIPISNFQRIFLYTTNTDPHNLYYLWAIYEP
jgi:hypothetical protein